MASNFCIQLSDSAGLMKVIIFAGLSHQVIVHPILHGEPVLTAQAYYYLSDLESVAQIRFEGVKNKLNLDEIDYLIDNYLFEFSKIYPDTKMSVKVARSNGKFWVNNSREYYIGVDKNNTESLAIDVLNDPNVHSVNALDPGCLVNLSDWNIGVNYARESIDLYIADLTVLLDTKITACISPSQERDGYIGKLRVLKPGLGLINHSQALELANISIRAIESSAMTAPLRASTSPYTQDSLPIERIFTTKEFTPILLSHYFSGLKEHNPLKGFIGFYNVLEYYFEEAPRMLKRSASNERAQLECVVDLLTTADEIKKFISLLEPSSRQVVFADMPTSSGIVIKGFDKKIQNQVELARWLYEIRCAVVHSKKTRSGRVTPAFEPYSSKSLVLRCVLPIVQWLAVLCIEKDYDLRAAAA